MVSWWVLAHCGCILASCTIVSLVKKKVHSFMCVGQNRDKEGEKHLTHGLGGKEHATLQFVSSKRGTKKVYTNTFCVAVWRLKRCTLHPPTKPGPLLGTNELITRVAYVGTPQAEEFKY